MMYSLLSGNRLKAGLKLTEEATKEEVQQSIHLVQDTSGFIIVVMSLSFQKLRFCVNSGS